MNKRCAIDLSRLSALGYVPDGLASDEERLAWGFLLESIDRLDFWSRLAGTKVRLGGDIYAASVASMRRKLAEVGSRMDAIPNRESL